MADYDKYYEKSQREKKKDAEKSKWIIHKTLWVPREGISKNLYFALHWRKKPKIK